MKLEGKSAIITGASSGIGKATALQYAKEGANIVIGARRLEALNAIAQEAEEKNYPGKVIACKLDITSLDDIKNIVKTAVDAFGKIDILINNAGILDDYKSLENLTDEKFDMVMDVNVKGVMRMSREVLPYMQKEKSGVILNTASVGGIRGMKGGLSYVTSKHAVVGMTKNIATTYADENIRAIAILPGNIETEIGTTAKDPDMKSLDLLMKSFNVFPKVGKADDIAAAFVFFGSDDAKFVNGASIVIDGGWTVY